MDNIDYMLKKLSNSKFRNSFHLKKEMKKYINEKGITIIKTHAYDFINNRIKNYDTKKDGKQTPMKGHPVFIAQHATATCCRGCIEKWYHIPKERQLTDKEIDLIVNILMKWINKEMEK